MPFTAKARKTGELFEATTQMDLSRDNAHDAAHEIVDGKSYDGFLYVDAKEVNGTHKERTFIYVERKWVSFTADELELFSVLPIRFKQRAAVSAEVD